MMVETVQSDDRLPVQYSFKSALAIYTMRLITFLAVVVAGLLLLGFTLGITGFGGPYLFVMALGSLLVAGLLVANLNRLTKVELTRPFGRRIKIGKLQAESNIMLKTRSVPNRTLLPEYSQTRQFLPSLLSTEDSLDIE